MLQGHLSALVGPSGVGKTALMDMIVNNLGCQQVPTETTRGPKLGDKEANVRYTTDQGMRALSNSYVWIANALGCKYATKKEDFRTAFEAEKGAIISITVETIPRLLEAARRLGVSRDKIHIFYLDAEAATLSARLEKSFNEIGLHQLMIIYELDAETLRAQNVEDTRLRLEENEHMRCRMEALRIPFNLLVNDGTIGQLYASFLELVNV